MTTPGPPTGSPSCDLSDSSTVIDSDDDEIVYLKTVVPSDLPQSDDPECEIVYEPTNAQSDDIRVRTLIPKRAVKKEEPYDEAALLLSEGKPEMRDQIMCWVDEEEADSNVRLVFEKLVAAVEAPGGMGHIDEDVISSWITYAVRAARLDNQIVKQQDYETNVEKLIIELQAQAQSAYTNPFAGRVNEEPAFGDAFTVGDEDERFGFVVVEFPNGDLCAATMQDICKAGHSLPLFFHLSRLHSAKCHQWRVNWHTENGQN